ncbi:MAG: NAD(P)H-hydrate dehydratase [Polyangiaceae bacterium]
MKPILSRGQIRQFDRHAIERCHVPGVVLMENAGRAAADVIEKVAARGRVVIVCGAGNNGGDGFVVARHLRARGWVTRVFLLSDESNVTGDARINLDAWKGVGGEITKLSSREDLAELMASAHGASVVVDAVFGTGLSRPIEGLSAEAISAMNSAPAMRVALDLPSGLDADTGEVLGVAFEADHTITFAAAKAGMLTPRGAMCCGELHLVDIGVPTSLVDHTGQVGELIETSDLVRWLPRRDTLSYKHAAGTVLVIAGAPGKTGAARLVAHAALRAGAGLCTIASWPECRETLDSSVLEVMTATIDPSDVAGSLEPLLRAHRVVVIGPGLGLDDRARRVIEHVVIHHTGVKVVDADAISAFANEPELLATAQGTCILTPHAGEMARLLGHSSRDIERDRFAAAREAVSRTDCIVVLKGACSLIAAPEGIHVASAGNSALATAGSGDTLAGIIGAMCCLIEPHRAASAGVMLHGLAADAWRARTGSDRGLLASEVADLVPEVLGGLFTTNAHA